VRGDCRPPALRHFANHGSPPRAWGLLSRGRRHSHHQRFTPTCVGTAIDLVPVDAAPPVHPHVRGDCG